MRLRLANGSDDISKAFRDVKLRHEVRMKLSDTARHLVVGNVFYKYRSDLVERCIYPSDNKVVMERVLNFNDNGYSYKSIEDMQFIIVDASTVTIDDIHSDKYYDKNIVLI